ncbi:DsrE family protein [Yunchengibacter salinarum]|uniref:DsrE family protein n=1 Tax=Yunchengibacter salinarum TaxID=3133399 RepID=UPI0035B5E296
MVASRGHRRLAIMVLGDDAGRLHMALRTGAAAASMGAKVTYFFSGSALHLLTLDRAEATAGEKGGGQAALAARQADAGVADTNVLLDALAAMDVEMIACETSLKTEGLTPDDLITRPRVDIGGLPAFMEHAMGGDWLTF